MGKSGWIEVTKQITGEDRTILLKVTAQDGGTPPLKSTVDATIKISGTSQQAPAFTEFPTEEALTFKENILYDTELFKVTAEAQNGGIIIYSIYDDKPRPDGMKTFQILQ